MAALGLEWRETARADVPAIVDYISDDNPDAAQRLKDEIEEKVSKLRGYRSEADVIPVSESTFARQSRLPGTLPRAAKTEGIVVYERP